MHHHHCKSKHGHCGHGHCHGKGGHHNGCSDGPKKGNRRKLFEEKYAKYLLANELPTFETDEAFNQWLDTPDGQVYSNDMASLWKEVEEEKPWGGKRQFAGRRKTCAKKIPFNRRINEDVLKILKQYSEKHQITETEALEKAIMLLEES